MRHYLQTAHEVRVTLDMSLDQFETLLMLTSSGAGLRDLDDLQREVYYQLRAAHQDVRVKAMDRVKPQRFVVPSMPPF